MHLFYTPDILLASLSGEFYTLNEEESKHCVRVLRLAIGAKLILIDGKGGWYEAEIIDDNAKRCGVKILSSKKETGKRNHHLHIAIAPTKNMDRLEWFIEKAVEIGIDEISLINCTNSERCIVKIDRIEKVAVAAIKQSLKAYLPVINEICDFKKFVSSTTNFEGQKFIAYCNPSLIRPLGIPQLREEGQHHLKTVYTKGLDVLVLIGPEGDFSTDEVKMAIDAGFKEISLGTSRLRTETAALYACAVINILNETAA